MKEQTKLKGRMMPDPIYRGQTFNTTIYGLIEGQRRQIEDPLEKELVTNEGEPLMGWYLPDFQRPPVWEEDQERLFIESMWLGLPIGMYVVNVCDVPGNKLDGMLIDGQQRIRAIKAYTEDKFKVFDYYYSQLDIVEKRKWGMGVFPRIEVRYTDIEKLKDIYNRLNFGGTAHELSQKAT